MVVSNKHVFWQAFVVAFVIFWTGILIGVWFEDSRYNDLEKFYFNSETDLFDISLEEEILSDFGFECSVAKQGNINFADRIYWEAKSLEKYDSSNAITENVIDLHRRYDLLRVMLWKSSVELKEKCPEDVNVVVYLYDYVEPRIDVNARQTTMGRVLSEVKERNGDNVILIPIAVDTEVKSLDLMKRKFGLGQAPLVVVNQDTVLSDLFSVEEIEVYFD
ncbi:hypothetical protein CMI47_20940 [Candidatus Pacearchaeota archaeon]|nr:hypothetical protein [Candidatus Pacearchaeota archaeon]|tara:strand:+ start:3257 stop:3913 length:657 start_codon:yes stop_codon:yes gene_type:complete